MDQFIDLLLAISIRVSLSKNVLGIMIYMKFGGFMQMNDEAVILLFSNFFLSILFILVVLILKCNQRDLWINNKLLILKRKVDASG